MASMNPFAWAKPSTSSSSVPEMRQHQRPSPPASVRGPAPSKAPSYNSQQQAEAGPSNYGKQHRREASKSSAVSSSKSAHHLRQRSLAKSHSQPSIFRLGQDDVDDVDSPFADKYSAPAAAMMDTRSASQNTLASKSSTEHTVAFAVRPDVPEWEPTRRFLYSDDSIHSDDTTRFLRSSSSQSSSLASRSGSSTSSHGSATRARYDLTALSPEVLASYAANVYTKEVDDALHDAGPPCKREGWDRRIIETETLRGSWHWLSWRGLSNIGASVMILCGVLMCFGGWPLYDRLRRHAVGTFGATNIGGINATGQVPTLHGFRGLIDVDTPQAAMTRTGTDGTEYQLVFSDEFNQAGRTFYEGEDPYWTAVDLHYWQTNDLEWYDPGNIITKDGYLEIALTKETLANSHNRGYLGGMLQSWNKFCFTGGYIEVAMSLPGDDTVPGLWPAAWTMANIGRAGFGGSLDGTWPYTYDSCDVGTLANQTDPATGGPVAAMTTGQSYYKNELSYLPGQRFSACTCPGEDHPGPLKADGTYKGRGASEIDVLEAVVNPTLGRGQNSQSAQWAPFNPYYEYINTTTDYVEFFDDPALATEPNNYIGGAFQQVTSGLSMIPSDAYNSTTQFYNYGFEYTPSDVNGFGTGYITWTQNDKPSWTLHDIAMGANTDTEVSQRAVTGEPMSIILNLGMSPNFGEMDLKNLEFPAYLRIDHVRVYQPTDRVNVGCDPIEYPTKDYIERHPEMYYNNNITLMSDLGLSFPKNRLIQSCSSS